MRITKTQGLILFLLLLGPAGCAVEQRTIGGAPLVRVKILSDLDRVTVEATTPPAVKSASDSGWRRLSFPGGSGVPVVLTADGWRVGNVSFPMGELFIQPQQVGSVNVNGLAHRGRYRLVPSGPGKFDVVNDVDVDSYLKGVVSKELLHGWKLEAYRAQAIVARTYALFEMKTSPSGRTFDLFGDERSQVYGGLDAETAISRQAVDDTAGVVVAYGPKGQERIFKAYFSSCCGGLGQSAYDAFGDPDIPPLRAKNVGTLCSQATRYNWGPLTIKNDELTRRIRSYGAKRNLPEKDMAMLKSIEIAQLNDQQRPIRFILTDVRGARYSLGSEDFRWACNSDAGAGAPILYSSYVRPISSSDSTQFDGHGWGHGVGMCQWCAETLAEQGKRHEDIILFSYPGAVLVRAY